MAEPSKRHSYTGKVISLNIPYGTRVGENSPIQLGFVTEGVEETRGAFVTVTYTFKDREIRSRIYELIEGKIDNSENGSFRAEVRLDRPIDLNDSEVEYNGVGLIRLLD